jgi:hypothetical protein
MLDPRTIWSQTQSILAWAPAWLAAILILVAAAVAPFAASWGRVASSSQRWTCKS